MHETPANGSAGECPYFLYVISIKIIIVVFF